MWPLRLGPAGGAEGGGDVRGHERGHAAELGGCAQHDLRLEESGEGVVVLRCFSGMKVFILNKTRASGVCVSYTFTALLVESGVVLLPSMSERRVGWRVCAPKNGKPMSGAKRVILFRSTRLWQIMIMRPSSHRRFNPA